jgi:hypothetical protein
MSSYGKRINYSVKRYIHLSQKYTKSNIHKKMKHQLLVVVLLGLLVSSSYASHCCDTCAGTCCEPNGSNNCPCVGGGSCRRSLSQAAAIQSNQYYEVLPCRFDCNTFLVGHGANRRAMFSSCTNPIVQYAGTFFKNTENALEQRCFDPKVWRDYVSTPGKLKQMIKLCQSPTYGCIKNTHEPVYADSQMPDFSDLTPVTSTYNYYWYGQLKAMKQVLGLHRCAPALLSTATLLSNNTCTASTIVDQFIGVSRMKTRSDATDQCPHNVASTSNPCKDFLGETSTMVPVNSTWTYNQRKQLAMQVQVTEAVNINVPCIPQAVKVTDQCLV